MEREALEGQQCSAWGMEEEELFLYPAESSTLTALPGVARVVHSKAFCTVHWLESGKCRTSAKDLPAAQILGIQAAPRGHGRQGRVGGGEARRVDGGGAAEGTNGLPVDGSDEKSPSNPSQCVSSLPQSSFIPGQKERSAPPVAEGNSPLSGLGERLAFRAVGGEDADRQGPGPSPKEGTCTEGSSSPGKEPPSTLRDPCGEERTAGGAVSPERPGAAAEAPPPPPPPGDVCTKDGPTPEEGAPEAGRRGGGGRGAGKEDEAAGAGAPCSRPPAQIREEGWSAHSTEKVTLAELYLMLGKPGKLQLEYDWLPVSRQDGRPQRQPLPPPSMHRVLRCLLRLVTTEVNPKPVSALFDQPSEAVPTSGASLTPARPPPKAPELCSTATSPVKPTLEEQAFTPPGKTLALGVRSPSCVRQQASIRAGKLGLVCRGHWGLQSGLQILMRSIQVKLIRLGCYILLIYFVENQGPLALTAFCLLPPPLQAHGTFHAPCWWQAPLSTQTAASSPSPPRCPPTAATARCSPPTRRRRGH